MPRKKIKTHDFGHFVVTQIDTKKGTKAKIKRKKNSMSSPIMAQVKNKTSKSNLEASFDYYWRIFDGPSLEPEYRFDTKRRWRFDRAYPDNLIAIELDGGTFNQGRHTRGMGYSADCEKLNTAILAGWRVFRLTSDMLQNDPQKHVGQIIQFILDSNETYQRHTPNRLNNS